MLTNRDDNIIEESPRMENRHNSLTCELCFREDGTPKYSELNFLKKIPKPC